jgi:hypothetical protein
MQIIKEVDNYAGKNDSLLSLWDIENMPACDQGMELARRFLEAAQQTLGRSEARGSASPLSGGVAAKMLFSELSGVMFQNYLA